MILKDKNRPTTNLGKVPVGNGQISAAQTFLTTSSYKLDSIVIKAAWGYYYGDAGTFNVAIKAIDGDGKPTGAALATATKPVSHFKDSHTNGLSGTSTDIIKSYTINFDSPTTLADATTYAMVFSITGSSSSIIWIIKSSPSGYTSGKLWGGNFTATTFSSEYTTSDIYFECYTKYSLELNFETGSEVLRSLGGVYWGGQTFTPTSNFIAKSIELKIKRADSDIGAVIVSLRAAATGEPSGEDITIGTVYSADISAVAADWEEFTFDIPYNLASGTQYSFVVRTTTVTYPGLYLTRTTTAYAGGKELYSEDSGDTWSQVDAYDVWFRLRGTALGDDGVGPISDITSTKKAVAIGGSEFWYVDSDGNWVVLSGSEGEIDSSKPLTAVEAYGKIFIANGSNLKVADFANIKITTTNIGSHPPDFGTVLTGGSSGAVMVVDYVDAISGAMNIYGRRINSYPFQAETITGLDDDENNISFTGTAETRGPHWYSWTVFGNSSNFGSMPAHATLVSLYNGRLVLAGSQDYPHEWWMSRVYDPFNFLYSAGDNLTAITSGSTEAGQIGDVITALISYADDFFVFGCVSSLYLLDGDPTYGGTIENISETEGVYGARSWCKDNQSNLYFFSGDGLYRADGGRSKPASISGTRLPNWFKDWELDPIYYRITTTFDPINNGIIISNTSLTNGSNKNYWYDITVDGFYPEAYPVSCGILSSYYYNATNSSDRKLLLGCMDGYIRSFELDQLDDEGTSADEGIKSWMSFPIISLNEDMNKKGKLLTMTFVTGRNVNTTITLDADGDSSLDDDGNIIETETVAGDIDYELYVENDAETLLSNMKSRKTIFTSGTISTSGRSVMIRPRARGYVVGLKLYNFNDTETWCINSVYGTVQPVGR